MNEFAEIIGAIEPSTVPAPVDDLSSNHSSMKCNEDRRGASPQSPVGKYRCRATTMPPPPLPTSFPPPCYQLTRSTSPDSIPGVFVTVRITQARNNTQRDIAFRRDRPVGYFDRHPRAHPLGNRAFAPTRIVSHLRSIPRAARFASPRD